MKPTFVDLIERLENCNFQKDVFLLAVSQLNKSRVQFECILKLIKNYAVQKDSIPYSLRVDVKLISAMASVRRKQEFLAIKEEANKLTEH